MVNREKRLLARRLIEGFAGGTVTSREIDADFPRDKVDRALGAIWRELWFLWDDFRTHTLTGKYAPTSEQRALINRCIAFLGSDLEYEWPPSKGASLRLILLRFLRLHERARTLEAREFKELASAGEIEVWPFKRRKDWDRVRSNISP
jgi:hypothetical protein